MIGSGGTTEEQRRNLRRGEEAATKPQTRIEQGRVMTVKQISAGQ